MPVRAIQIPFPSGGVNRRLAYSSQTDGPMPCPWAVNTRLESSGNRLRGGSFAGIDAATLPADEEVLLTDESGNVLLDGSGEQIYAYIRESVISSDGRSWVVPGADTPANSAQSATHMGRLLRVDGNVIFASRINDFSDYDFSAHHEDLARPWAIQLASSGEVGDTPSALIPHEEQFLLCATVSSLWVLQGDPHTNGTLTSVARDVGIVGARAWAKDASDTVFFMSEHGLYAIGANGQSLTPISENAIPEELTGLSDATLTYNQADRGLYIETPGADLNWFYDIERQNFWPFDTSTTDSHLLIGPIKSSGIDREGVLNRLHGMFSSDTTSVDWRIVVGETAEEAAENGKAAITAALAALDFSSYVRSSGTWNSGRSYTSRPRVRNLYFCIWLSSAGAWAFERITAAIADAGAERK